MKMIGVGTKGNMNYNNSFMTEDTAATVVSSNGG